MHIRESEVSALESVGELFMIDSKAVQDGCLEVMNVNFVFNHVVSQFVGATIVDARSNATTCHPDVKATRVMVSSIFFAAIVLAV